MTNDTMCKTCELVAPDRSNKTVIYPVTIALIMEGTTPLSLLTTAMHDLSNEVWAVQRETPEDSYLHGALDAVYQALENACGAAEDEMSRKAKA